MTAEGPLVLTVSERGLVVSGEIDAHTAPMLAEAIAAAERTTLELDLAQVAFVDSSGLRVLIDAHQQLEQAGGELHIVNPSPAVQRLLEISGIDGYLNVN
jgi:anti-sigma B factor antagonist